MQSDKVTSDTEVDLCANCDKPRAKHSVEYGEQLPFCSTNPNDGRRFTPKPDSTVATFDAAKADSAELRRQMQDACAYDHSGVWCRKCGYQNPEAVKREHEKARNLKIMERSPKDPQSFVDGFEAGYAYANELLKNFYALGAPKLP